MLTAEIMHIHMQTSSRSLDLYLADPVKFLRQYVIMDDASDLPFRPRNETTRYAVEAPNLTSSSRVSKDHIGHKIMASVFSDRDRVLMIDYLKQGNNVTCAYYAGLVHKLHEAVKEKCQGKLTPWVLLHNDNAPAHISHVSMVSVHECGFELLSQPPYFADLVPSDFQRSRYLKESLCGRAFEDDEAVIMAINERTEEQDQNFFCESVKTLQQRWENVLIFEGIAFKNN